MGNYRSLDVWRMAHQLTVDVYRATSTYPSSEQFGLIGQTRRAAASIPMNLAEGCGRNSDRELRRYSRISLGSANELTYQLLLAFDLRFLDEDRYAISMLRRIGWHGCSLAWPMRSVLNGADNAIPTGTNIGTQER